MPTVTALTPQKRQKKINIYLDGKFGFGVDLEVFIKSKIKVGQSLTQKEIQNLKRTTEDTATYNNLLRFATLRPRSAKEINDWFYKKKIDNNLQAKLEEKLKKLHLLDDEKFAQWWLEQRVQFRLKSTKEIIYELKNKGVDSKIVEDVLYKSNLNETDPARKLLQKKRYKWQKLDKFSRKKKMTDYLLHKGFSWEVVKNAIKDIGD